MNTPVIYNNVPTPGCIQTPLSVATPDGGLLYTGFKCINYISAPPANEQEAAEVKTMSTRITISALDVSPLWAKTDALSNRHFAIVAEDLSVQVWDCALGEAIIGHKAHQHQHEARDVRMYPLINVLMGYVANGNILSIDASDLVIYCVASNSYCRRPTFLSPRNHQLSVLRCSPFDEHLFALGTMAGAVLICDLRKMCIVHKLNAHGQNVRISGLAWREMSFSSEDAAMDKTAKPVTEQWRRSPADAPASSKAPLNAQVAESDDPFDIYNFDHLESEFGAPANVRPPLISKSSDDCGDFVGLERPTDNMAIDYVEACERMKAELMAPPDIPQVEVTLQDCQKTGTHPPRSDSSNKSEKGSGTLVSGSSEGSLEVIQFSYSSDDAVLVDGEPPKPKREVLHHIYHQAEVHDAPESPKLQTQNRPNPKPGSKLTKEASMDALSLISTETRARPDILLVSINDNDVITVWNTLTGEHCAKNYSKINVTGKSREVHWLNDQTIVSQNRQQLFFWSFEYDSKSHRYKIQKDQLHRSASQEIATCAVKCADLPQIWLTMRNRQVGILNPLSGQLSATYGCLAFGVRAIAECPDDMNKIALGCSDKRLALFDISKLSSRCIPIDSIHVNSVVYSLAWSPDCLQLAYGTYDGIVGVLDVERMRVKTTFRPVQKKEIYSLMWQANYIFCIVNRVLAIYDLTQPQKDAQLLRYIERPSYLYVRGTFLFVGTEDGFLQLYERTDSKALGFTSLKQTALISRYITDIAFNPLETNQFAVVGHEKLLHVMEFQAQQRGWIKLHTFTASDPKASITSVKWSNIQSHLLLSFHIEGKVCLWSTKQPEQPPLTITYHCPMWCGLFLPSDESIVMCSGKTLSLELISIKDALARNEQNICSKMDALLKVKWASKSLTQPHMPVLNAAQKKRQRRDKRKANQAVAATAAATAVAAAAAAVAMEQPACISEHTAEPSEQQPPIESMLGALSLETKSTNINSAVECSKCKELKSQPKLDNFLAHSRTCLCLTQKELNKSALQKLAIVLTEDAAKIDKAVLMSKLFSTKVMAKDLIATELTNLKHSNNKDIAPLCLAVSTFKVRDELQQHIDNKTLNEWHVSVAPSVSFVFWQKCCKAYAQQMEEQGYILHAATYLTAIDMQTEAIDLLLKHEYFREALANARIHLPATDPVIKTIINKWLEQLEKTGNFAAAALICVLDNEMLRGYTYLRKFRNCTPEIADLMEQIKRIGQLGPLFDDGCQETAEAAENGGEKNAETAA
ncbi:GH19896 [Drosophila grimshawi]|uniref:GH19896 n=1 Tax=Drosophila grimshawi TaxID=7222 RepID=B4J953_DROGR|nr:GH19896 [Drosophila grimshawi]